MVSNPRISGQIWQSSERCEVSSGNAILAFELSPHSLMAIEPSFGFSEC